MKKAYLPFAIALLAAPISSFAGESEFKIYGKANLSLNNTEDAGDDQWELNSNASRLGIKGGHKVNDDIEFIYKLEYETYIDDGDKGGKTFGQRNIFAGIKTAYGTLIAGKHDSPLKLAQGKIDRFNDLAVGDIKNYAEGEDRVNNIIMYTSPKKNGFSATVALVPGEGEEILEDGVAKEKVGLADGTSISVNYSNDWVKAALAHNGDIDNQDTVRLAADFKFGASTVGFIVQQAEQVDGSADEDTFILSGVQKLSDGWAVKLQLGMTEYSNDDEDFQFAIGVDKKLSKKSKLFAYYSNIEEDSLAAEPVDTTTFAAGYEIKF